MHRIIRILLWCLFTLALAVACDQWLVQSHSDQPVLRAVQTFYRDFRTRLLGSGKAPTIESVIEQQQQPPAPGPAVASPPAASPAPAPAPPAKGSGRYLYVDAEGQLQFADSLDEVPARFRHEAKPLQP